MNLARHTTFVIRPVIIMPYKSVTEELLLFCTELAIDVRSEAGLLDRGRSDGRTVCGTDVGMVLIWYGYVLDMYGYVLDM